MSKVFKAVIFLLLIATFFYSSGAQADRKNLNLKMIPKPVNFSSAIPKYVSSAATRSASKGYSVASKQMYKTPNYSIVFRTSPMFEWDKPQCNPKNPCTIRINQFSEKDTIKERNIFTDANFISNTFVLNEKTKLIPGSFYTFNVSQPSKELDQSALEATSLEEAPIYFYELSKKEQTSLNDQLKNVKETDKYNKEVAEIYVLIENGVWFDTINKLNELISDYPENKDLIGFKDQLYNHILGKNKAISSEKVN